MQGWQTWRRAWDVQKRVWGAIFMREIQTRWGRRNLGFAWLFAEPLLFAFPVLLVWSYLRGRYENGVPMMPFLWSGYLPILMFRHTVGHAIYVVRSNAAMLYHRSVTPLDLIIGRCALELMGNFAAMVLSYLVLYVLGVLMWPHDVWLLLVGYIFMAWWCFSLALIIAAASERTEIIEHIFPPIGYIYLPISGFFYLAAWLPTSSRDLVLKVMPSLQAYEMIREGLMGDLVKTYYDMTYLSFILSVLTLIGLLLSRGIRQHLQVEL